MWSALASAALVLPAITAAPASAAPKAPVVFDALGDSYGSGYGVPPYSQECGRSAAAYAVQIDGRMRIQLDDFAACAGATTNSLEAGQLWALDEDTDLVTVSIGGNDIGWGTVVAACVAGSDLQCAGAIAATTATITDTLPGLLRDTYSQIEGAAPNARGGHRLPATVLTRVRLLLQRLSV